MRDGFYSWVAGEDPVSAPSGITCDPYTAIQRLCETLPPGSRGRVQAVRLNRFSSPVGYAYGAVLLRVRHDPDTGDIVVDGDT
ncbi:hypothetical protein HII36_25815 [Nonomuraea sp. NN258]|uniref:hypothetical protein n=1 Tax=Nonomuraea antri TaxID=2730852 RepID=UPI0015690E22|nr:hypothetical protein [Nonomuraea antri]NRQ35216.1 hypothetical protein [Nonomuraea antri]